MIQKASVTSATLEAPDFATEFTLERYLFLAPKAPADYEFIPNSQLLPVKQGIRETATVLTSNMVLKNGSRVT
jgi:hypothetical protein